jgi:hypothetical protein
LKPTTTLRSVLAISFVLTALATMSQSAPLPDRGAAERSSPSVAASRTSPDHARPTLELATVSARPGMVSGGSVLVEGGSLGPTDGAKFVLNDADVSDRFVYDAGRRSWLALLTSLRNGPNLLVATIKGRPAARLLIENHPAVGPIFSGPRQHPWICETEASGLGPAPTAGPCVAPTRYDWFYKTTGNKFVPLESLSEPYPADMAKTTTLNGRMVNYIVRVESGTINESIYRIAILDDPRDPIRDPWSKDGKKPGAAWNGKLVYFFGGGVGAGFRSGSSQPSDILQDVPLSLGFAVASATRNIYGVAFDDVTSSETTMMLKQHFIENYGIPRFTIGTGGSGGAVLLHYIVATYPGLVDGIIPSLSQPDLPSLVVDAFDCLLINNYFDHLSPKPATWTAARRTSVDGGFVADAGPNIGKTLCQTDWFGLAPAMIQPTGGFSPVVPQSLRYDPVSNPTGARGTIWDGNVNSWGKDPRTGFARSGYSNVGIQYGLKALNDGDITPEEFVDLNEHVGGLDINGQITPHRSNPDLVGLARGYESGRVITSFHDITLPIIDWRPYSDDRADVHPKRSTFAFLERMKKSNGTTANEVNWIFSVDRKLSNEEFFRSSDWISRLALLAENQWLDDISSDTSNARYAAKVIADKPPELVDACWIDGERVNEPFSTNPHTRCNRAMPMSLGVRMSAGAGLAGDVLSCRLRPVNFATYQVTLSASQKARLLAAFPNGVCDWSAAGNGQAPFYGPWIDFGVGDWSTNHIHGPVEVRGRNN